MSGYTDRQTDQYIAPLLDVTVRYLGVNALSIAPLLTPLNKLLAAGKVYNFDIGYLIF